ncbi:MAG: PP2C family protein-serine/threonine phosphatase [Chloroflexota bacterium]
MKRFSSNGYHPLGRNRLLAEIEASGLSIVGPVREDNQDAILLPDESIPQPAGSLFAVADGMGGYTHGAIASALALETLFTALQQSPNQKPEKALRRGIEAANLNIFKAAQNLGVGRMGTTLTAAYICGSSLYLAHVGDSRAYLMRQGKISCLTNDHTLVGDMVRARLIAPAKVRTHAQRSILTRALGLAMFIQPDVEQFKLEAGDRLILCSDGVWSALQDEEIAQIAGQKARAETLGQALVDQAVAHETDDNCSAVVMHVQGFVEIESPADSQNGLPKQTSWLRKIFGLNRLPVEQYQK